MTKFLRTEEDIINGLNEILDNESEGEPLESLSEEEFPSPIVPYSSSEDDVIPAKVLLNADEKGTAATKTNSSGGSGPPEGRRGQQNAQGSGLLQFPSGSDIVAPNGTTWNVGVIGDCSAGRYGQQNVFKDRTGPSLHAKRNVNETCYSTWHLMIMDKIYCKMYRN
ncbi:uncharacterized protein LOC126484005 [Schistocerca serialis cubense]|uniref:uncharacterized protein LOC126484005 n=1 Tax=Schistocerca serialis cubense TaxID=2023355 RepID=UPI00214ED83B|nr:uncharacterized protein LOC126484005 [Schistocerca serialis cubense]